MSYRWVIDESRKCIVLANGDKHLDVSGIEVWNAEFSGAKELRGASVVQPSVDIPELYFSRFSADICVVARGSLDAGFRISFAVEFGEDVFDINDASSGQCVAGGTWCYLDQVILDDVVKELALQSIHVPSAITLGQLIYIRASKDALAVPFHDCTDTESGNADLPSATGVALRAEVRLFPYQERGVAFLAAVAAQGLGCLLADEMGLGKTLQVIALLTAEKTSGRGPCLVISPATLLENWFREISRFAPCLAVMVHSGGQRSGNPKEFLRFDVVICSYETAVRDEPLLASVAWNVVTLDEAQSIKNPEAQRTRAVKGIPRRVSIAVTGTPIENKLTDLWSISDFVLPGLLGSQENFRSRYDDSSENAASLEKIVRPVMLRRRVADVALDLPNRIDISQSLTMTRGMAESYDAMRKETMQKHGANAALVVIGKLRQFCAHPDLTCNSAPRFSFESPKLIRLLEILDEIFSAGQKALIFTSYLRMADILCERIGTLFPGAWIGAIDGRMPVPARQSFVDAFSRHPGNGCLVLNPKAAGVGLNITSANHVIHYNPEWNPALQDQASARAYRLGQRLPVTVHHLFFSGTVEELMLERLQFKRDLAAQAVIGHGGECSTLDIARALEISPLSNARAFE